MSSYSSNQERAQAAFNALTNPVDRYDALRPAEPRGLRGRGPQATVTTHEVLTTRDWAEPVLHYVEMALAKAGLVHEFPDEVREALENATIDINRHKEVELTWANTRLNLMYDKEKAKYDKDMIEIEKAWEAYANEVEVWVAKKNVEHKLTTESKDRIEYERLRAIFEKGM